MVRETTEALPFTNGIDLPEGLSASQVETAWRIVWATLATLQVLAGYALVFPVYTNPLSFLAVMGAGWGILYGALGNVEEGGKWLRHYCLMHVVFSVILLVAFTLSFPYPNLWNNLVARSETIWTSLFTMEHLAAINYPMAVIWFIAVVGSLISVGVAFYVRNAAGFSIAVIFVVMLLFLIFLGQRTVDAASNLHDASGTTQAPTVSGDLRSGNIASSGELNPSQPYYANPTGKLVNGEAYKYPNVNTVYMYENGKFRPFKDDLTYYAHYGCHRNQRVIDCHRVEEIPAGIDVHATKYKGEIVTS
ncbi:MAG TPA: hypothetical protein VHQ41_03050 [Patescibacteria group bacterium]|nr:hypothetical protein [Patescibacteria group bacterium]